MVTEVDRRKTRTLVAPKRAGAYLRGALFLRHPGPLPWRYWRVGAGYLLEQLACYFLPSTLYIIGAMEVRNVAKLSVTSVLCATFSLGMLLTSLHPYTPLFLTFRTPFLGSDPGRCLQQANIHKFFSPSLKFLCVHGSRLLRLTRHSGVPYQTVRDVVQCLCAQHQRPPLPLSLRFVAILPLTQCPCSPALWSAHLFPWSIPPR